MERRALTRRLVRIPGGRTGASSRRVLDDALQSSRYGTSGLNGADMGSTLHAQACMAGLVYF
jgi:hypothetical protein